MSSKKIILLIITILIAVFLYTSIQYVQSQKPSLDSKDAITVGTNAEYPPFTFQEKKVLKGFDIDVMNEIGIHLNKKIVFKDMPFDVLVPEIQLGNIHIIAAGLSATPERELKIFFTPPVYSGSPLVIITLKNKTSFTTPEQLTGKTVVVNEGYIADMYISKIPGIHVHRISSSFISEGLMALRSGRADAFIATASSLHPFLNQYKQDITINPIAQTNEEDCLAVSKKYPLLFNDIKKSIHYLKNNGTLDRLTDKWFNQNSTYSVDTNLIINSFPDLLKGLFVSLKIALFGSIIGILLGTLCALLQTSGVTLLSLLVFLFITIIRGTPMLIQILFMFYLLPHLGIMMDPFWTAVIAIGLNSSAYISQVIKSGIQSINRGQIEAAQVLGFNKIQTMRYIILPQALSLVLPGLGNELITLVKDSSLASIIGVSELSKEGRLIISRSYDSISIFLIMALLYLLVTTTLSFIILKIEHRMHRHAKD